MREPENLVIDGETYFTSQYGASFGLKMFGKITALCSESLAELTKASAGASIEEAEGDDVNPQWIEAGGKAISKLANKIDPELLPDLTKQILSTTKVSKDGNHIAIDRVYDAHFAGRMLHLFKVVGAVLMYQYEDFRSVFTDLTSEVAPAPRKRTAAVKAK